MPEGAGCVRCRSEAGAANDHQQQGATNVTEGPVDFAKVWFTALTELDDSGIPARDRAYLRLTRLVAVIDTTALLAVPYKHTKEMLEGTLRQPVRTALAGAVGHDVRLAVTVDPDLRDDVEQTVEAANAGIGEGPVDEDHEPLFTLAAGLDHPDGAPAGARTTPDGVPYLAVLDEHGGADGATRPGGRTGTPEVTPSRPRIADRHVFTTIRPNHA